MGAKVTFDPVTREARVTLAPDANGVVYLNVKTDLYSDGKEDWLADPSLQKMKFPIKPIGGDPIPIGVVGDSYILTDGWRIAPYEADHEFVIDGNLFVSSGELVKDTVGQYRVKVTHQVSTLVEVRTDDSATASLASIASDLATLLVFARAKKVTSQLSSKLVLTDAVTGRTFEAELFKDEAETEPYNGEGIEVQGDLIETTP